MTQAIELYPSPLRPVIANLLASIDRDLLIACPFIKTSEADWICNTLTKHREASQLRLQVLTYIRSDSVLNGSLDLDALKVFARAVPRSRVIDLPRLHAKVFLADDSYAIVGSSNLTPAGLDSNYEYGVGIKSPPAVARIRADLEAYARIGNSLAPDVLDELAVVGDELSAEYQQLLRSSSATIRRRFNQRLRRANFEFLRAQVGSRSANSLFSEAIIYLLSKGPLTTRELHPRIQRLLPDLCDDSIELVINGERFGKRWKHGVRNAQQFLKRSGVIHFDGRRWHLALGTS